MDGEAVTKKSTVLEVIKTVIVAVIISLVAMLIMAFIIKICNIDDKYLSIITQIIKGVSIFLATVVCVRIPKNGWVKGIIIGIVYILIAFLVFSTIDRQFKLGLSLLNDIAIGAVSGMISGIVAVAIRK